MTLQKDTKAQGFTLLEVLVVLLLIALGSSLAVFALSTSERRHTLKRATRQVEVFLKEARAGAVLKKRVLYVQADEVEGDLNLLGPDNTTLRTYRPPEGITLKARRIVFFPNGSTSGGSIVLSDGRIRYRVTIEEATGIVRTERQ